MVLTVNDHHRMLAGFERAGYSCFTAPSEVSNPLRIRWYVEGKARDYRLWAFDVTHGGGGSTVRAADEFRIQITNGPNSLSELDSAGATDLLVGYSRDRDAIVAYDRQWLSTWIQKKVDTGSGGSPSVQVKEADIRAGHDLGIHHLSKNAGFGEAHIVTMSPQSLPAYLLNHDALLRGNMTATQAHINTPVLGSPTIVEYCHEQGFPFEPELIARYLASLLTKPLVILAGVSGTGKSKLAELVGEFYARGPASAPLSPTSTEGESFVFAPAMGAPDPSRFALVPVRPDWIDNQAVFGFLNPVTATYESTQALDLILRAEMAVATATTPATAQRYFMLLDEMNLARVEHYFSDWLACMESRRVRPNGSVAQRPVALHRHPGNLSTTIAKPDGGSESTIVPMTLEIPINVVVTGTVNVDETTYGFSPKVLDRAMVIEFDDVDLARLRSATTASTGSQGYRFPDQLPPFRLANAADYSSLPFIVHERLVHINSILEQARLHLGYRSANEIGLFMSIYETFLPKDAADNEMLRALDVAVLQKVLPRLSGNRAKLELPLARLCVYLRDLSPPDPKSELGDFDPGAPSRLSKSYRRAIEMLAALRDFGFVSFFK